MTLSLCNHLAADSAYQALRRDVLDGLASAPKSLPPKWFYDSVGSDLFDQITRLPEYYPTRAEAEILRVRSAEIAAVTGADTLVELGSGTSEKTRTLLQALDDGGTLRRFVPFDVDASMLSELIVGVATMNFARFVYGSSGTIEDLLRLGLPHIALILLGLLLEKRSRPRRRARME